MSLTTSRLLAGLATFAALGLVLWPTAPLTLGMTLVVGSCAAALTAALHRRTVIAEFVTGTLVPVLGLALVVTPALTVVETHSTDMTDATNITLTSVLPAAALGVTAALGAALLFPLAVGTFSPDVWRRLSYRTGQYLPPLGVAVLAVFLLAQFRIFERLPSSQAAYSLLVSEPAQTSSTSVLVTWTLAGVLVALVAFLCSRPLDYGLLYPEERDGAVLLRLSMAAYHLSVLVVGVGWVVAFLLVFETMPGVSYPDVLWLVIQPAIVVAEHLTLNRFLFNALLGYLLVGTLLSPIYLVRRVERTGVLWLIRHVLTSVVALVLGLSATAVVQRLFVPATVEPTELGDATTVALDWLPVVLTALLLVGTLLLYLGALLFVTVCRRDDSFYSVFLVTRNVGIAALFCVLVLAVAGDTPTSVGLVAGGATVIAWDTLEFDYVLRAELPGFRGVAASELVHAAGIVGVVLAGVVLALAADAVLSPVVVDRDGALLVVLCLLVGTVFLLFALRE